MATGAERARASRERRRAADPEAWLAAGRARAKDFHRKNYVPKQPMTACPCCGELKSARGRFCTKRDCVLARNRERQRVYNHERRARIQGNEWERFDPFEVYERDGWVCQICDEPVDRAAPWPAPESVSLDHIVPVSLGGPHTRKNTRCSHLGCNSRRGNRTA